jgi:hypothetical protein
LWHLAVIILPLPPRRLRGSRLNASTNLLYLLDALLAVIGTFGWVYIFRELYLRLTFASWLLPMAETNLPYSYTYRLASYNPSYIICRNLR